MRQRAVRNRNKRVGEGTGNRHCQYRYGIF